MLMPGAKLSNGVIVGARSVVNGTIPDYAIIADNPAKIIRMRFSEDEISELNRISWWDWDDEKINSANEAIEAADIEIISKLRATDEAHHIKP